MPVTAVTRFGASFTAPIEDSIQFYMYFFGVHEPGVTKVFRMHLRPGDTCIDIGANVGAHTLLAAHLVGPKGTVHAIEASPTIHATLRANLERNGGSQVHTYNVAVTQTPGPVTVFMHGAGNIGATTIMDNVAAERRSIAETTVPGLPLAEILPAAAIEQARLMKIDVEGAEWLVLQGRRDLLPHLREDCLILIEINPGALAPFGKGMDDVLNLLASAGFQPFEITNDYSMEFYARPPARMLRAEPRRDRELIDVGFARPRLHAALLEADRVTPS